LQTWRKTLNRQRVGLIVFLFFIPAVWQVQNVKPTLFSFSVGWLCKKVFVVHGEESQAMTFAETLRAMKPKAEVFVPEYKQSATV